MSLIRSGLAGKPSRSAVARPIPGLIILEEATATVVADATPHIKGAWVELVASTSAAANLVGIVASVGLAGQASGSLIDIGIGAAGSEVAIASNIAIGSHSTADSIFPVPLAIAAGSRLAVRVQSVVVSKSIPVVAVLYQAPIIAASSVDVLGASTSTSVGSSATSNTWSEIIASTAQAYRYLVVVPSLSTTSVGTTSALTMRVGVGAAGSEVERGYVRYMTTSNEWVYFYRTSWLTGVFPGCPAGVRIAARSEGLSAQACVIGVPY